jgi:hypothetical protein
METPNSKIDQTIEQATESAIAVISEGNTREHIQELIEAYHTTIIPDLNDQAAVKFVSDGLKRFKKLRTGIEAKRKELNAPALEYQRTLKSHADGLIELARPTEIALTKRLDDWKNAVEAKRFELFRYRSALLTENGFQIIGNMFVCGPFQVLADTLSDMEEADLNMYVAKGKESKQRAEIEEKRRTDELEALAKEREEIQKMREELAKEKKAVNTEKIEVEAQKTAIEKTYKKVNESDMSDAESVPLENDSNPLGPVVVSENEVIDVLESTFANIPSRSYISEFELNSKMEFQKGFNQALDEMRIFTQTTLKLSRGVIVEFLNKAKK